MLTGILTKPASINKGQDNIMTLDRDALLADVIANKDSYFHQLGRWSQVLITYKSSQGEQLNHLEFDPTTGAFPTANFNPSIRARNTWQVQTVMIRDLDDGEVIYYRDELDTAHFDIILDQIAPTLQTVSIASDNVNPAIANVGDTVTLTFTGSEPLANVSASILGQSASISGSGTNWTASYTLVGGESSGLVPFIIEYQDLAGNQGNQVINTTDASSVTVQYIIPTLDIVTIYSDNVNTAIAEVGDTITLDFTASDQIASIAVSILGNNVNASLVSGNQYRAQYTVQGGDAAGIVPFSIDYEDLYSNSAPTITGTTDSTSVTVEYVVPNITLLQISSDNVALGSSKAVTGDTVTILFNSDDTISNINVTINGDVITPTNIGVNQYQAQYSVLASSPDGNVNFTINYTDQFNNPAPSIDQNDTTDNSFVEVDNTAPQLTTVSITSTNGDIAGEGDDIILTFTANETINTPTVTILGNAVTAINTSGNNWRAEYTVLQSTPEGVVNFTIDFEDDHENQGTQVTSTTNGSSVNVQQVVNIVNFVNISSNNLDDTSKAVEGDIITLSFSSAETIQNVNVTILGQSVTATNVSGNNWEADITVQAGSPQGNANFTINYQNTQGQTGQQISNTTNGSFVNIDTIAPTLPIVTISSNNTDPTIAEVGDIITLNFTSSEQLNLASVVILGTPVISTNISGNNWQAQYTVTGNESSTNVTFTIDFEDAHLNQGIQVTDTTDNSSVTLNLPITITLLDTYTRPTDSFTTFTFGYSNFTKSLDFDNNYFVVGENGYGGEGKCYLFNIQNETINFLQGIDAPVATPSNAQYGFGTSVSLSGNSLIISYPADNNSTGVTRIYNIVNNSASLFGFIQNGFTGDGQGYATSIDGDYLVTSSLFIDDPSILNDNGGGHLYKISSGIPFPSLDKLDSPLQIDGEGFGRSISISGNYIVVGSNYPLINPPAGYNTQGSVSIFKINTANDTVSLITTLTSPNPSSSTDFFGTSVSIDGDNILISSEGHYGSNNNLQFAGEAYLYKINTSNDTLSSPIILNDPNETSFGYFGSSTAIDSDNSLALVTSIDNLYSYSTVDGSLIDTIPNPSNNFRTSVAVSNNYIVTATADGKVNLYRID